MSTGAIYKIYVIGRKFETRWGEIIIYLILKAALGPGVYSASNRNEYRKHKKKCFWGAKCGWCMGLTTLPPSMIRWSRQCGIFNISQPYRPPRPVTGIALLFFFFTISTRASLQDCILANYMETHSSSGYNVQVLLYISIV
jgi:hypothetical protein